MKNITFFILLLSFFISSCQPTYQYEGAFPETYFYAPVNVIEEAGDIFMLNLDTIPVRNRIYLTIDTTKGILLNNHIVAENKLMGAFDFAINNPKKLKHLPVSLEDAIILMDLSQIKEIRTDKVKHQQELLTKVTMTAFIKKILGENSTKPFTEKSLNKEQVMQLEAYMGNQIALGIEHPSDELDKGIRVKLPPWSDLPPSRDKLKKRNVFDVLVNEKNELIVEGEPEKIENLKERAKAFIANPNDDPSLAESPKQAIISLKNDRGTDYTAYITVYNMLKAAYTELWDEAAKATYNTSYNELENELKKEIRKNIPLVISEAEAGFGEK